MMIQWLRKAIIMYVFNDHNRSRLTVASRRNPHTNITTPTYWHFGIVYGFFVLSESNCYAWNMNTSRHSQTLASKWQIRSFLCEAGRKALRVAILSTARISVFNWSMNVAWNNIYHFIIHVYACCCYCFFHSFLPLPPSLAVLVIRALRVRFQFLRMMLGAGVFFFVCHRLFRSLYIAVFTLSVQFIWLAENCSISSSLCIWGSWTRWKVCSTPFSRFCVCSSAPFLAAQTPRFTRCVFIFVMFLHQIQWNANNFLKVSSMQMSSAI